MLVNRDPRSTLSSGEYVAEGGDEVGVNHIPTNMQWNVIDVDTVDREIDRSIYRYIAR